VRTANGKKYYFLIFSSSRQSPGRIINGQNADIGPMSQLYMTAIVEDAAGNLESFGPSFLWNQRYLVSGMGADATYADFVSSNVTPAWDEFQAPAVPPVVVVVK
jgi:hypothetical protein